MDNITMKEKLEREDEIERKRFEQQSIDELARELYIHKDIAPKKAFDMAQEFVDLQYNTEYRNIRTMSQTIQVRYIVERHSSVYGDGPTELHIACTDIKGFKVLHPRSKDISGIEIPTLVESKAREQLDELLKKDGQRAGRINVREVNSFYGDF